MQPLTGLEPGAATMTSFRPSRATTLYSCSRQAFTVQQPGSFWPITEANLHGDVSIATKLASVPGEACVLQTRGQAAQQNNIITFNPAPCERRLGIPKASPVARAVCPFCRDRLSSSWLWPVGSSLTAEEIQGQVQRGPSDGHLPLLAPVGGRRAPPKPSCRPRHGYPPPARPCFPSPRPQVNILPCRFCIVLHSHTMLGDLHLPFVLRCTPLVASIWA